MIKIDHVNAIVGRHIFPAAVSDTVGTFHFGDWKFSGFIPQHEKAVMSAEITAISRRTGAKHVEPLEFYLENLPKDTEDKLQVEGLFRRLDVMVVTAIKKLVVHKDE